MGSEEEGRGTKMVWLEICLWLTELVLYSRICVYSDYLCLLYIMIRANVGTRSSTFEAHVVNFPIGAHHPLPISTLHPH